MTSDPPPLPLSRRDVVDRYFLEHRAKVLDIAAFLDRVDRAGGDATEDEDFRVRGLRASIGILLDGEGERTRRVLELLSDQTADPIEKAPMKGAAGAWDGFEGDAEGSAG